jgi:hypothetical protein
VTTSVDGVIALATGLQGRFACRTETLPTWRVSSPTSLRRRAPR